MVITVFISSVSGSTAIKKNQTAIISYLTSKQIPHRVLDLAEKEGKTSFKEMKEKFLKEVGEEKPFPAPQVFNDDSYCGDYQMFFDANEDGEARTFFKLDPSPTAQEMVKQ